MPHFIYMSTDSLSDVLGTDDVKRVVTHSVDWLSLYCVRPNLLEEEELLDTTAAFLKHVKALCQKDNFDMTRVTMVRVNNIDDYEVSLKCTLVEDSNNG